MNEEDRQLWILVGSAVFFFGLLMVLIVVGMVTRYRMEIPYRAPAPGPEVNTGSPLLSEMGICLDQTGEGGLLMALAPVTNAQYGWFVDEESAERPVSFLSGETSGGRDPVLVSSREQALQFCEWLSERADLEVKLASSSDLESSSGVEWTMDGPASEDRSAPRPFRIVIEQGVQ